ncbi:MAG: hypothetical protein IH594_06445 [Bacteroidales bacterium]|nr:hypothetical protein [Bacteroidales bacterium]
MKIITLLFFLWFSLCSLAQIPFRLPAIISNHAVLQHSSEIKLWGWGPGSLMVNSISTLKFKDNEINSFAVAGSDRKFYNAKANIEKDGTLSIFAKEVREPVVVRYRFNISAKQFIEKWSEAVPSHLSP